MYRKVLLALALPATVIGLDIHFAGQADAYLRANDYFFAERLREADLASSVRDGDQSWKSCSLHKVYRVYVYQTCFVLSANSTAPIPEFDFIVHKPLSIVAGGARTSDSYYFQASELGETFKVVRQDGLVLYSRVSGNE